MIVDEKKLYEFTRKYFRSMHIQHYTILLSLLALLSYLTNNNEFDVVNILITITVGIVAVFLFPDYLKAETNKSIKEFYQTKYDYENKIAIVCNIKKIDGPTFGVLVVDSYGMSFVPFRDNLMDEKFSVNKEKIVSIEMQIISINLFNRVFYRELCEGIFLVVDDRRIILQTAEASKVYSAMKKVLAF
ncbi:hypothetical protein PV797_16060 [Clostridiaceae bacterium M8S5]|nr:hypothetical protein PV797_16060 [Clostridiaceae bacterium M8S5]